MANEIITTLHPDKDSRTNLYPNIKSENIPLGAVSLNKLDTGVKSILNSINELKPSGVDNSATILAFKSDKGIWVGNDTGYWYYWNGRNYVVGGDYIMSIADFNKLKEDVKILENKANVYFDLSGTGVENTTQFIEYLNTNEIDISNYIGKIMFYKNDYGDKEFIVIPTYEDREPEGYLISNDNIYKLYRPEQGVYGIREYAFKDELNTTYFSTINSQYFTNPLNLTKQGNIALIDTNANVTSKEIPQGLTTTGVSDDFPYKPKNNIIIPIYSSTAYVGMLFVNNVGQVTIRAFYTIPQGTYLNINSSYVCLK